MQGRGNFLLFLGLALVGRMGNLSLLVGVGIRFLHLGIVHGISFLMT